jgi:hypothetical protein
MKSSLLKVELEEAIKSLQVTIAQKGKRLKAALEEDIAKLNWQITQKREVLQLHAQKTQTTTNKHDGTCIHKRRCSQTAHSKLSSFET